MADKPKQDAMDHYAEIRPFPPRTSMAWENNRCEISYDETVSKFAAQDPKDKNMNRSPLLAPKAKVLQAQRAEQQSRIAELQQTNAAPTRTVALDPNNAYWPPYNPLAKEGEKEIDVVYHKQITSLVVMSNDEAYEFLQALYEEKGGKSLSEDFKTYIVGVGYGSYNAVKTAQGLGGFGVQAVVKKIDGVNWVIIRNFRFHQQTLMTGYKWKANNPQVVKAALGIKDLGVAKNFVRVNVGIEIAFAVGINAVDYILRDGATLAEFVGNSAYDIVKGVTALAGSTAITALLVAGFAVSSVLVGGLIFVAVSYIVGSVVSLAFDFVKGEMEKEAEKQAEREAEDYIERINGYSFSMSDAFRKVAL